MFLQVGKKYLDRKGNLVEINKRTKSAFWSVGIGFERAFTLAGESYESYSFDLIQEVV